MASSRRLRRDLREIGLIVAGVLIALAANATWGYFQDRSNERIALRQLLQATLENEHRLLQAIYEDSTSGVYNARFADLAAAGDSLEGPQIADIIIGMYWFSDFHPLTGTYAALAQNGDLNLIRNDTLRAEISAFAGELESTMQEWRSMVDPMALSVVQGVSRFIPYHALSKWRVSPVRGAPPKIGIARFRDDPLFREFLENQMMSSGGRLGLLHTLCQRTTRLRQDLERELNQAPAAPFKPDAKYFYGAIPTK